MSENLPKRKITRLQGYDYSTPGAYFITFCTHEKRKTLSSIRVGAIHESPVNELTEWGKALDEVINSLPAHLGVNVDKYVIMPNHIHLLLSIDSDERQRAIRESPLQGRSAISKAMGYIKMNSSRKIHAKAGGSERIFQRSFHDHIIRNEEDYRKIWEYIDTNPARWESDCFYSEQ